MQEGKKVVVSEFYDEIIFQVVQYYIIILYYKFF